MFVSTVTFFVCVYVFFYGLFYSYFFGFLYILYEPCRVVFLALFLYLLGFAFLYSFALYII